MTKTFATLIADVGEELVKAAKGEGKLSPEAEQFFKDNSAHILNKMLVGQKKVRASKTLYISEIGHPCVRKLWYKVRPELFKPASYNPAALFKFIYGDLIELLFLTLAINSGHAVTHYQHSIEVPVEGTEWKIRGRCDAVIDGVLIDVKSASPMAFNKFKDFETLSKNDSFGYIMQLITYWSNIPDISNTTGFVAIEKVTGDIVVPTIEVHSEVPQSIYRDLVESCEQEEEPHRMTGWYETTKKTLEKHEGSISATCNYCEYKDVCIPKSMRHKSVNKYYSKHIEVIHLES